jgi:hypothetical protein
MNYLCKTRKWSGEGLCHCCSKFDRGSTPAKLYPEMEADFGLSIVNLYRREQLKLTTLFG